MLTGLLSLEPSFPVERLPAQELTDIFLLLRLDHPEIFWAVKFSYRFYQQADTVEFVPEYMFKKKQIQQHQQAMEARINKLVRQAVNLSEAEKEQYVHDFICRNVCYDKLKKPYSHEIIGPLGQGVGVCEGIAKSVKILCDRLGLWCIIAISDNNPKKGIRYRHTWNIIRLNGNYYHLDATFDNSLSRYSCKEDPSRQKELNPRYDYYNLSDTQVFCDHEPVMFQVPACKDSRNFWYRANRLSFTKLDEIQSRAVQAARKGKEFTFHWRGGSLNHEIMGSMLSIFQEAAMARNLHPILSANVSQSVFRLVFSRDASKDEVVLEYSNEGEQEP